MRIAFGLIALALTVASAQDIKFPPSLDKLAAKAKESNEVTLDANMLQLAGKFLSSKDADEAGAKKLVGGLKSIYVRNFEFAKEGEYDAADVEAIRSQLKAPEWSRVVSSRSKGGAELSEVYLRTSTGSQIGGLVVISAEPKELTIVNISGAISPDDLKNLGGQFGIPKIDMPKANGKE
jgi:hypothetical protein